MSLGFNVSNLIVAIVELPEIVRKVCFGLKSYALAPQ